MPRARRKNQFLHRKVTMLHDHTQALGSESLKLVKLQHDFHLDRVFYLNPDGLAEDASDYYTISLKSSSGTMAQWSTAPSAEGSLPADSHVELAPSGDPTDHFAPAGDVLTLELAETGSQTLPSGRIQIEGRYI